MATLLTTFSPGAPSGSCVSLAHHYAEQTMLDHVTVSSDLDYRDLMVSKVLAPMLDKLRAPQQLWVLKVHMTNFGSTELLHSRCAADHVMIKIARSLRTELPSDDVVARVLDRELMIASSTITDTLGAEKLAERIRQICAGLVFRFGLTFQPDITWAACSTAPHLAAAVATYTEAA